MTMEEIAALRYAAFAMTIEPKTGSIQQFAKTANCGHDTRFESCFPFEQRDKHIVKSPSVV